MEDIEKVQRLGLGKVDVSVGSALDIFGGNLKYSDLVHWSSSSQQQQISQETEGSLISSYMVSPSSNSGSTGVKSTGSPSSSSSSSANSGSSSSSSSDITIRHDTHHNVFIATLQGSTEEAKLMYTLLSPNTTVASLPTHQGILDITSTRVPDAFRGRKIAARLADEAFLYAEKNQYLVKPSCSYIADTYLQNQPEKKKRVITE